MINYIQYLQNHFIEYSQYLTKNNIISNINNSQINIDYLSNNKQGDVASNFYLIIKKKIIDKNYNIENELVNKFKKYLDLESSNA